MTHYNTTELKEHYLKLNRVLDSNFILENAQISSTTTYWLKRGSDVKRTRKSVVVGIGNAIDLAIKELSELRDFFDVD